MSIKALSLSMTAVYGKQQSLCVQYMTHRQYVHPGHLFIRIVCNFKGILDPWISFWDHKTVFTGTAHWHRQPCQKGRLWWLYMLVRHQGIILGSAMLWKQEIHNYPPNYQMFHWSLAHIVLPSLHMARKLEHINWSHPSLICSSSSLLNSGGGKAKK